MHGNFYSLACAHYTGTRIFYFCHMFACFYVIDLFNISIVFESRFKYIYSWFLVFIANIRSYLTKHVIIYSKYLPLNSVPKLVLITGDHIFSRNCLEAVMIPSFKKDYISVKDLVLFQNGKMLSGHPLLAFQYICQNC